MSKDRMSGYNTITLGGLIEELKEWCELVEKEARGTTKAKDSYVFFDWANATPKGIDSYRGYYEHLALGYADEDGSMKVGELIKLLKGAIGETYTGWKGGNFKMTRKTPVWVSNVGHCSGTTIRGVGGIETHTAIIVTGHEDDE